MHYESYNPKDRRITSKTQATAWLFCVLLMATLYAVDGHADRSDASYEIAIGDDALQHCG